jgi:hypothetical protein
MTSKIIRKPGTDFYNLYIDGIHNYGSSITNEK